MTKLPLLLLVFESKLGVDQRKFAKRRHEPFSLLSKIHSGLSAGIRHLIACSNFEPKPRRTFPRGMTSSSYSKITFRFFTDQMSTGIFDQTW